MIQRGRKTTGNNLVVLPRNPATPPPLSPPDELTRAEKAVFAELVKTCDVQHFVPSDAPLLAAYAQAILLARKLSMSAAKKPDSGVIANWERVHRVMGMFATRLRLAPQSRGDPKTIGTKQRNAAMGMTKLWDDEDE